MGTHEALEEKINAHEKRFDKLDSVLEGLNDNLRSLAENQHQIMVMNVQLQNMNKSQDEMFKDIRKLFDRTEPIIAYKSDLFNTKVEFNALENRLKLTESDLDKKSGARNVYMLLFGTAQIIVLMIYSNTMEGIKQATSEITRISQIQAVNINRLASHDAAIKKIQDSIK